MEDHIAEELEDVLDKRDDVRISFVWPFNPYLINGKNSAFDIPIAECFKVDLIQIFFGKRNYQFYLIWFLCSQLTWYNAKTITIKLDLIWMIEIKL